jgi:S1-C subfamily serine protease
MSSERNSSRTNFIIYGSLVVGLIILLSGQIIVFRVMAQKRSRTVTSDTKDASLLESGAILTSSVIQFVSCSDDDLPDAVAAVRPAIVNIDVASSDVGSSGGRGGPPLAFDIPSSRSLETNEETLGSGIIVDSSGYVLTCHHLIRDYPVIYVTLFGANRKTYEAEMVAVDIENDLAVLKINPDSPIPVAMLANSDMVKTTDTVLAIGSPFGFEHTVTAGIVSDNKRSIVIGGIVYRDFFQTDTSINRGSAGGALINTEGEVIGVNTAIASESSSFSGISFAIPINKARSLLFRAIEGEK